VRNWGPIPAAHASKSARPWRVKKKKATLAWTPKRVHRGLWRRKLRLIYAIPKEKTVHNEVVAIFLEVLLEGLRKPQGKLQQMAQPWHHREFVQDEVFVM
jgi:hypothetical protein